MQTLLGLAITTLLLIAALPAAAQDKTLAIVVKGLDNPFSEQDQPRLPEVERGEQGEGVHVCVHRTRLQHRRGRRGADRRRSPDQGRGRRRDLAFEGAADGGPPREEGVEEP